MDRGSLRSDVDPAKDLEMCRIVRQALPPDTWLELASVHSKPVMPHAPAAGVLLTASLHAYATVRGPAAPHEYSTEFGPSPEQLAELLGDAVLPRSGVIRLTGKPGLGLELDERALDRLRT